MLILDCWLKCCLADGIQIIEKSDFREDMVKFRATLERAGSVFNEKKNSYEFEF